MALKNKREALASIKVRSHSVKGVEYKVYDVYLGTNCITKQPERLYASSKKELEDKINEFYRARCEVGDLSTVLTAEQIIDAKTAIGMLQASGVGISLAECARREIERSNALKINPIKIGDAYNEFIASKPNGEDKNKTIATTGKWVEVIGKDKMMNTLLPKDVREYLMTYYGNLAPKTYNSHLSYIRTFLNWCIKHDPSYIKESPAAQVPLKVIAWKEPEYMKPAEVKKLFRALERVKDEHPEYLAMSISGFFCGVRRAESLRMADIEGAARIDLEDETVRIAMGKGYTKGRRPRASQIEKNALAWMKSFDYIGALKKVEPTTTQNLARFAERNGIRLFHNAARHTFITMHVAAYGDPAKTQAMVGTSGTMLCNNYRGLASKKDGEAYFAIYPSGYSAASDTSESTDPAS